MIGDAPKLCDICRLAPVHGGVRIKGDPPGELRVGYCKRATCKEIAIRRATEGLKMVRKERPGGKGLDSDP